MRDSEAILVLMENGGESQDLAAHFLAKANISAIRRIRKTDNNRCGQPRRQKARTASLAFPARRRCRFSVRRSAGFLSTSVPPRRISLRIYRRR